MMEKYIPSKIVPIKGIDVPSAWIGLESIMTSIITDFELKNDSALEFGCEYGYSTSVLAQLFKEVTAVDTFKGDVHSGIRESFFEQTLGKLENFKNIKLIQQDALAYIDKNEHKKWDLIHIDIVHTYLPTFLIGAWSLQHSDCVIFHDYVSFPDVKEAVDDLLETKGICGKIYEQYNGLAILYK